MWKNLRVNDIREIRLFYLGDVYVPMDRGQRAEDGINCPALALSAPFS